MIKKNKEEKEKKENKTGMKESIKSNEMKRWRGKWERKGKQGWKNITEMEKGEIRRLSQRLLEIKQ